MIGWRAFTQDVGLRIEAGQDEALLRTIARLKERLDVNVELASPLDFMPAPAVWPRQVALGAARSGGLGERRADGAVPPDRPIKTTEP